MENNKFDNLFDYCVKTSDNKILLLNNIQNKKNNIQKKRIYNNIISNININYIKNSASEGKKYYIIKEGQYNKLIEDLLPNFKKYFSPFKVFYKKKNIYDKTFMQTLSDENTYILYISWNITKEKQTETTKINIEKTNIEPINETKNENIQNDEVETQINKVETEINKEEKKYNDNNKLELSSEDYVLDFEIQELSD